MGFLFSFLGDTLVTGFYIVLLTSYSSCSNSATESLLSSASSFLLFAVIIAYLYRYWDVVVWFGFGDLLSWSAAKLKSFGYSSSLSSWFKGFFLSFVFCYCFGFTATFWCPYLPPAIPLPLVRKVFLEELLFYCFSLLWLLLKSLSVALWLSRGDTALWPWVI